ncbi:MAG: MMPL family transporter, partial [Alphaproteobacteria bacterium]|nr:MMPL family transporter [Alphaproteobacteria bacterium]
MVALAALGAYGYKYVGFSDDYRVFFAPENPDLIAHDALQRTYINVDTVNFVLKPKDGSSILTREHLAAIWELTEAAWQIPYTVRVDSLSNYQHTRAEADDLIVEDLVPDPQALDEERVALVREVAMTEPALFKRHISADGTTTSIIATLQIAEDVENVQVMLAPEVHAVAEEFREAHPDLRLAIGGHVMMSTAFFEVTNADVGTLFPLMFLFLAITLMLFLRSFFGALAGMIVVLLSVLAAMGTHFFFGVKLTPVSGSAPVIILTVAVADSIHLLVSMGKAMAR